MFEVNAEASVDGHDIADQWIGSTPNDQADLINELGMQWSQICGLQSSASCSALITAELTKNGRALVLTLAAAIKEQDPK